jgi:hypothetical protein
MSLKFTNSRGTDATPFPSLPQHAPLPDSFRFGVAISDHQAEAYEERFPLDIWDSW